MVIVGSILLLLAVVTALAAWPKLRVRAAAKRVHLGLAAASGLSSEEAAWLWRVACTACPERPALVFVRPSLLEVGPNAARPELAQAVRDKLFAS